MLALEKFYQFFQGSHISNDVTFLLFAVHIETVILLSLVQEGSYISYCMVSFPFFNFVKIYLRSKEVTFASEYLRGLSFP